MYDNGADVVYHAAGKSGLGLFDAVVQAGEGNWAIGVDSDQYLTADEEQKPYILTSMLKRVDTGVVRVRRGVGERQAADRLRDLRPGERRRRLRHVERRLRRRTSIDQIDDYKQQIIDGEIKVPAEL